MVVFQLLTLGHRDTNLAQPSSNPIMGYFANGYFRKCILSDFVNVATVSLLDLLSCFSSFLLVISLFHFLLFPVS